METIKNKIINYFKDFEFDEKHHTYYLNKLPLKISVSNIIKKYVTPFNSDEISLKISNGDFEKQKKLLEDWNLNTVAACDLGKQTHLFAELYPNNKNLKPTTKFQEAVVKFWNDLPEHIIPVFLEVKMYHKIYLFAGTADLLLYDTKTDMYIIVDYKSNKDIFKNFKGKKMLGPFSHLLDTPYNKYQLQLSFYQILFEQLEFKISARKIVWLRPDGNYEMYDTNNYTNILNEELKTMVI